VILHYHIFKNAGTSFDQTLSDNFGAQWSTLEAPAGDQRLSPADVAAHLVKNPGIRALSSHTAALPPPTVEDTTILAVTFVRHPLDRARSVYDYERLQAGDNREATVAAREMEFPDYLAWRLDRSDRGGDPTISNFQALVLARAGEGESLLERAMSAVDRLAFVGLVEEYERSLARLQERLRPAFLDLRLSAYRLNVTEPTNELPERLSLLRERAGRAYERLSQANAIDLQIWEHVRGSILSTVDTLDIVQTA
jgi:hypothetical protein